MDKLRHETLFSAKTIVSDRVRTITSPERRGGPEPGATSTLSDTVTIQDEPGHRVQNGDSVRRLPTPTLVAEHLRGLVRRPGLTA